MALPYDSVTPHHVSDNPYADLPGTRSTGYVPRNTNPVKTTAVESGRQGCHPTRWIYELLNNCLSTSDLFKRDAYDHFDPPFEWRHEHRLVFNGNQSQATSDRKILSSICLDCHFHFVFKLSWDPAHSHHLCDASRSTWPVRDGVYPWHHLVWAGSDDDDQISNEATKYYPLRARERFVCSAPPCTFQIVVELSDPRLRSDWIYLLRDEHAILQKLQEATEADPERYQGATEQWAKQAPLNLNTYLKNLLESDETTVRSISKRNKRFAVVFGQRCFGLFRHLGFKEEVDMQNDSDEGCFTFVPPGPPTDPEGITATGTYRGYIEDVRAEVQCLIHRMGQVGEKPSFISAVLHADLGCKEIPNMSSAYLTMNENYKLLGVLPGQPREIIAYAYFQQWHLLPTMKLELIDSLMAVANHSNDEELSNLAMTQSSVFLSQIPVRENTEEDGLVNQALIHLGLSPPNTYSAEAIIEAFRRKLMAQPADASTSREMILLIAQASTDDNYQASLLMEIDQKMSLDTCRYLFGDTGPYMSRDDLYNAAVAVIKRSNTKEERRLYIQALDTIAEHTSDYGLKDAASELREQNEKGPEDADESTQLPTEESSDLQLPVGLYNIGNTCYLNSLLQYLYTVKAVREIATNYDDFKLDLTDDSISQRRLGGNKMEMDRGEAIVAQVFVHELQELFTNLHKSSKIATKPSQRLANAALLSTHGLLEDSKAATAATAATAKPPPLPERPSPTVAEPAPERHADTQMTSDQLPQPRDHEISSHGSSTTLIDMADEQPKGEQVSVVEKAVDDAAMLGIYDLGTATGDDNSKAEDLDSVDSKILQALEHQKRSSGTEQQDVDEVMGKIISLLQAAIKPTSVDPESGIQSEKVMETFVVTTVNYTKKLGEKTYQSEVSYDLSITAFPAPEGECSLYEALGQNFDQQVLEDSQLSRYTAIRKLPPVLHVLIQRTLSTGQKNSSPVIIPETLYLDRYMDTKHESPEFRRRTEDWATSRRVAELKKTKMAVIPLKGCGGTLERVHAESKRTKSEVPPEESDYMMLDSTQVEEENWDFDGTIDDEDYVALQKPAIEAAEVAERGKGGDSQTPEGLDDAESLVQKAMDDELEKAEQKLEEHFSSSKKCAYRLEAVICHSGTLRAGHYWVWIHDFENGIWRCYNDAVVRVETDTAKVLTDLSKGGEPYYLCYVRDEEKEHWVDVPKREVPEAPAGPAQESPETQEVQDKEVPGIATDTDTAANTTAPKTDEPELLPGYKESVAGPQ